MRCTMAGGIGSDAILQIDGERQVDAAVFRDLQADCDVNAVATVAPA